MAAPDVSAVVALTNKAFDLRRAGHLARSKDYHKRALAAALALGAEDCLIVATLQLEAANCLLMDAFEHREQRAPGAAPPFEPAIALFCTASATVQRRRAAGTLLGDSCRAAEEMFDQLTTEHIAKVQHHGNSSHAAAQLMGYTRLLEAASIAGNLIGLASNGQLSISQEQLCECVMLIADTAELVIQPRIHETVALSAEGDFMDIMQRLMTLSGLVLPHGAAGVRLRDSWRRLQQSGVLQRRRADKIMQTNALILEAECSAAAAAAAAPGLRSCALERCGEREAHPQHFKSCAACRGAAYCCKQHQTEHWPSHKAACKAARKAAEQQQAD